MTVSDFERIRTSLLRAENQCIAHLNEISFQSEPTWDDIHKAYILVNELREIQDRAVNAYALCTHCFPTPAMHNLLKRSAAVLCESLLIVDEVALRYHTRS